MENQLNEQMLITGDMLKLFYEQDIPFTDENGNPFPVPEDGSLGLLSLGHRGLVAWRKKRMEIAHKKQNTIENSTI